ncbi:WbqC-like protein family [Candidatus Nanopelagicaceae bacterium]
MQPTFLPWLGYFKMMQLADRFIFLDDVQISPKSFQVRNRIPNFNGHPRWIGVKVDNSRELKERKLNSTKLLDPETTFSAIEENLRNYYSVSDELESFVAFFKMSISSPIALGQLNMKLILYIANKLGIADRTLLASDFSREHTGSTGIVDLLEQIGATEYLVAPGSLTYMATEDIWRTRSFLLTQFEFIQSPYYQSHLSEFMPFMSALDCLLELGGEKARRHFQESGYKALAIN